MFHFSFPGASAVISRKLCLAVLSAGFLAAAGQSVFAHEFKVGDLEIEHPWSRETPVGARVAGGYFTVKNNGASADRLVAVTSEVSAKAEVHQMAVSDGVMTMRRVDGGLEIPAGGTVALDPGGYNAENAYWKSFSIRRLARDLPGPEAGRLKARIAKIAARYDELSGAYQSGKAGNDIPLN